MIHRYLLQQTIDIILDFETIFTSEYINNLRRYYLPDFV